MNLTRPNNAAYVQEPIKGMMSRFGTTVDEKNCCHRAQNTSQLYSKKRWIVELVRSAPARAMPMAFLSRNALENSVQSSTVWLFKWIIWYWDFHSAFRAMTQLDIKQFIFIIQSFGNGNIIIMDNECLRCNCKHRAGYMIHGVPACMHSVAWKSN